MKAAIRTIYGGPERISIQEIEKLTPSEGQILVRVKYTTVNRTDAGVLTGRPYIFQFFIGLFSPKRKVLGTDFVGIVEESKSDKFSVGDRIMGLMDEGCESQAEYVCVNETDPLVKIPDSIDDKTAVCSMEGLHYAINFLNKVDVKAGQEIMINGGTGAIGSAAIQLCKNADANVVATCRGDHMQRVLDLGADRVINYEKEDFTEQEKKFDFVFDAVGKSTFPLCRKIMKSKAIYISSELGPASQNPFFALVTPLLPGKTVKFPFPSDNQRSLDTAIELLESGKFKPLIDRTFKFEEVKEAYAYMMTAKKVGNVVLEIG